MSARVRKNLWMTGFFGALALLAGRAGAQIHHATGRPAPSSLIVPQVRAFAAERPGPVEITEVRVGVVILEQAATTTMDVSLRNPGRSRQEAELVVPVPDGAVVRSFTFQGAASEPTAQVLPKDDARRTYDAIVAKFRDPALLEFVGYDLIRSSVFPVEAGGTQKVRLTYEHLLGADGNRVDYVLPRSERFEYTVPWQVSVKIKSKRSISTVYSPSHRIETRRAGDHSVSLRIADGATAEPGPFLLSYLIERDGVTASLFAYPDRTVGGGYFLMLAGLPARPQNVPGESIRREVTLVIDRSGSMRGEKIEQVREAALQILEGLEVGEAFNVISYNETIDLFSKEPVVKSKEAIESARRYLQGIRAHGGTNIHDALLEALRQEPAKDYLPIVLFLTDGLPTVGQTSEVAIRDVAAKANPYDRRVFTFGVGVDVNTPLLKSLAMESRGAATFVLPGEDVEVKVSQVYRRLSGPVLAGTELEVTGPTGEEGRVREVVPLRLPDLFEGDQLVVLGRYIGDEPLTFKVSGNYLGKERTFRSTFTLDAASTRNAFVPRLWASRRIAVLVDAIRRSGADVGTTSSRAPAPTDPRLKELVDEIVRLSTDFGILTEYTAFLAREGTDLAQRDQVLAEAQRNFVNRAIGTRSGLSSVNQTMNNQLQLTQQELNRQNRFLDANMNRVTIANVQQLNDMAFYRRGGRWVDGRIVEREKEIEPMKVIEFGSSEFQRLALRLAGEGRQSSISLAGDILMVVDGEPVLVKGLSAP